MAVVAALSSNKLAGSTPMPRALRSSPRKRIPSPSPQAPKSKKPRAEPVDESELDCAACPAPGQPAPIPGKGAACDRETWISCTHCKTWFHCICIALENPDDFSKWYCQPCITRSKEAFESGTSTSRAPFTNVTRPPRRKSDRAKLEVDYAAIQEGIPADPLGRWKNFLNTYDFEPDNFRRMEGPEWTIDWLMNDETALRQPVLVPAPADQSVKAVNGSVKTEADASGPLRGRIANKNGRPAPRHTSIPGMVVPPSEMTIFDVADIIGHDTPVEVIDVASQSSSKASWTISEWAEYFDTPKEKKKKTLNVISLEVTGTPMQAYVEAPQLVRDLDWVTRDWPQERRDPSCADNSWPKVQRYVLMGVEGAYSDWHIDFAGSSVYYHVIWGQKTFLFAPPTPRNLAAYKAWCSSTRQDFDWLGDHLHSLTRVDVRPGETMLIPSGWLHCVYTPKNTLVVGGNFLTDWNVATQWKLVEIEEATKVPRKFRFPHLKRLSWFVGKGWNDRLEPLDASEQGAKGEDGADIEREADVADLVDVVPPLKVVNNIELVYQSLSDDLELIQDPYIAESGDERTVKQQKAAREAIPVQYVGHLPKAEAMLATLRGRLDKAKALADSVHKERVRLTKEARGGKKGATHGSATKKRKVRK
ncbi:Zinc finger, RING/FYVE/PHD-type [Kalmanozyma brasiliensis GHG001]|uniref:JmjC domain-containing histone demethylation protein 1 n=1 Tax=Kalmanozyma brasiliensis (strain GHG001) TaxID=1365824 RepID=V5F0L2_KALBG|nr:Zinc finger, RING/FYVE/PHD-type [Kalmanozyma brasiliensis GHG001]EST08769.1 Zinc finger, RING/FYVE/PHD-type [Kalmanozyma brasiliensis GHG001]